MASETPEILTKKIGEIANKTEEVAIEASTYIKNPSKIIDFLKNIPVFKTKTNMLLLLITFCVLLFTAYYIYKNILKKKLNPTYVSNNEFSDEDSNESSNIVLKLYHAKDWCPHSREVLEPTGNWTILKNEMNNKIVNGKLLEFDEIDCSNIGDSKKDDGGLTEETKNIDGYPTIKMVSGDNDIIYNNDISTSNELANKQLKEFINNNI